jgi:glycosyltransferase involved in cell wall biosynthesis
LTTTVIIPLYNKATTILKTISSLLQQESLPNEIIIIDDCSTDDSYNIMKSFLESYKNINKFDIKLHKNLNNSGPGITRNLGIEMSKGDIIFFLDADDTFERSYISEVKNIMENNPLVDIIIATVREEKYNIIRPNVNNLIQKKYLFNDGEILYTNDFVAAFCYDPIFCGCGNVALKKKCIKNIRFSEIETNYEDWHFFYEISKNIEYNGGKIYFFNNIIGLNYNTDDSDSLSRKQINSSLTPSPNFIFNETIDFRFRKYIYYNWIYSTIKRMKNSKNRLIFFKSEFNNFRKFSPPILKFILPIILMLLNFDLIVNLMSFARKRIKYA